MQVADLEPLVNDDAFLYYPRLRSVADYTEKHITDRITLGDAARVAGLERKYFSAYFRSKVGITWMEWLRLVRLVRAVNRIETQESSILRIALGAGFHDVRTFERAFKRYLGVPPMIYRAGARPRPRLTPRESRTPPRRQSDYGR